MKFVRKLNTTLKWISIIDKNAPSTKKQKKYLKHITIDKKKLPALRKKK